MFHFINNLLSLLMQYIPVWVGKTAGLYLNLGIALCLFVAAGLALILLLKRRGADGLAMDNPHGWLAALLRSPLVLYLLLMLLYAVL